MKEFNIPRVYIYYYEACVRDIHPRLFGLPSGLLSRDYSHFNVEEAFLESWKELNVEYIDMYLMHWPQARGPNGGFSI
jgi:aryl-alcohol dehydrogenase-like predicted oxidoreductase